MRILALKRKVNLETTLSSGKMKIDQEKFNQLRQLDRIEFRQKKQSIDTLTTALLIIEIICLSFSVVFVFSGLLSVAVVFAIMGVLSYLLFLGIDSYGTNKIEKEYFKVEVKK